MSPSPGTARTDSALRWTVRTIVVASAITLAVASGVTALGAVTHDNATKACDATATLVASRAEARARSAQPVPATATRGFVNAPPATPTVVLYGDSLAWESQDFFRAALNAAGITDVHSETFGGTAICDWLDQMRADAITLHPTAVVLEFSGNALTRCMQGPDGQALSGVAYWEHYRADAQAAISIFASAHSRIFVAGSPISRVQEATGDFHGGLVNAMYEELAGEHADVATYVDAGAAVLDHGHWTATLPCLLNEPCTGGTDLLNRGVNVVRAPDGGHFCPASEQAKRGVVGTCPVWSSGAFRYGNAMATPVLAALGR
jgi:hypothetical protein